MTKEELETKYLRVLAAADMKAWRAYTDRMRDLVTDREFSTPRESVPKSDESVKRYQRRSTRDDSVRIA